MIRHVLLYASDMYAASRRHWIWRPLAHLDLRRRFRRSVFGLLWIVFQNLFFAVGVGLLWSSLFDKDPYRFIPFVAAGLAVWSFITSSFTNGCHVFHASQVYLKQIPVNSSIFIYRAWYGNMIVFMIVLATSLLLVVVLRPESIGVGMFLVLPGVIMVAAAGFVTMQTMAYIGMRFHDVQHGLPSVFQLLFVLTPIFYPIEMLRMRGIEFAEYVNPFASIIEVVRAPLIDSMAADWPHYLIVFGYIAVFQFLSVIVHARWKREMPYWL